MVVLGGAGGDGDDAGDVTVDNSGQIITRGARSHGILAQSIGGGGGNAEHRLRRSTQSGEHGRSPAPCRRRSAAAAATAGTAVDVTVNHSGDITVLGDGSQAVVAESINGGGGHVALDFTGVTSLPGGCRDCTSPTESRCRAARRDPVIVFSGGGDHQQNSDAGRVTLNYTGTFGVAGNNGAANAVQAIGGGGGTFDLNLALNDVGGQRGRRGDRRPSRRRRPAPTTAAATSSPSHDGDLVTEGDNTPGALVQSIGGGGGRANLALTSEFGSIAATTLTLGGENGNNEEGGDIDHTQTGSVSTQGASAHGGVFQSIGGGGGAFDAAGERRRAARRPRRRRAARN